MKFEIFSYPPKSFWPPEKVVRIFDHLKNWLEISTIVVIETEVIRDFKKNYDLVVRVSNHQKETYFSNHLFFVVKNLFRNNIFLAGGVNHFFLYFKTMFCSSTNTKSKSISSSLHKYTFFINTKIKPRIEEPITIFFGEPQMGSLQ